MLVILIIIIVYAFVAAIMYVGLMIYYINGIKSTYQPLLPSSPTPVFISVVVCFRNEEKQLPLLLQSLIEQDYPVSHYEILLYNDSSSDGSLAAIKNLQAQHQLPNISYTDVLLEPGVNSSKKWALNHASHHSLANLILVTDADCVLNKSWLKLMAQCYDEQKAFMISAPVAMIKASGWINDLQRIEMQALTAVTAGAFGKKSAIMCNGANLAFDRKKFLELNPYQSNLHISSGDDMFLMMAMQKENHDKIFFLLHQNAVVNTSAKANLSDYLNQRIRWASKSKQYQNNLVKVVALIVLNINAVLLFSPLMILFLGWLKGLLFFITLMLLKQLADGLILIKFSKIVHTKGALKKLFIFQYLEALLTLVVAVKSIRGSYIWKDRKQHF